MTYKIRYTVEHGDFKREDAKQPTQGLTQKLIIISCIEHDDGSYSQTWVAYDGETKQEMNDRDVFKAWIMMAETLTRKKGLLSWQKEFCAQVFHWFKEIVFGGSNDKKATN